MTGKTDDDPRYVDALPLVEAGDDDAVLIATPSLLARLLVVQEALLRRAWDLAAEVHEADHSIIPRRSRRPRERKRDGVGGPIYGPP